MQPLVLEKNDLKTVQSSYVYSVDVHVQNSQNDCSG